MNVLFRCDGSKEIGMGHVVRCLALADELHDDFACTITFAMRQSELGIQKVRESYPVIVAKKDDFNYELWLTNCIQETKANILIMDMRDGLSRELLLNIKKSNDIKVVTIDDPEDKRLESDMAFYPPVPQVKEMNWGDYKGELFTGWEYVILRKEFLKKYPNQKHEDVKLCVCMGGSDPYNITLYILEILSEIEIPIFLNIIIGLGYQFKENLLLSLSSYRHKYKLHINPINVAQVMASSDLGLITFGVTAYEMAALEVFSMYLCLSNDHSTSTIPFIENNYGINIGIYGQLDRNSIKKELITQISNQRTKISSLKFSTRNLFNIELISRLVNKII